MTLPTALGLLVALPRWYFGSLVDVFLYPGVLASPLGLVPIVGIACLAGGIAGALRRRSAALWLFAVPPLLSQLLVGAAGAFYGQLRSGTEWVLLPFLAVIFIVVVIAFVRAAQARWPAFLLSVFSITYAFFAAFIAGMALADSWL